MATAPSAREPQYNPDEDFRIVTDPFLTRAVLWTGLAAGTFLTVVAVMHGFRVPGVQVVLSVLLTWVWAAALAVVVAALLRRHHRALARHGRRGAVAAGRGTRRGTGAAAGYLAGKAATRWQRRQHRPLLFTRDRGDGTGGQPPVPAPAAPASEGRRPTRRFDGKPESEADTRFFDLRARGYTGPIDQDGNIPAPASNPERTPSMTESGSGLPPGAAQRASRRVAPSGGNYPATWKQVVSDTADFEPENDGHLLEWMASEVNGMSAYAEALTEVYETAVNTLGLDPVAMAALHDTADAGAEAASAMAGARAKFAAHYSEVREFAASGGLLPYDGRWITGDGDA